jgi:hypothetical protein
VVLQLQKHHSSWCNYAYTTNRCGAIVPIAPIGVVLPICNFVNNDAVFAFSNGDPLTPRKFTDTVKSLLFKHVGNAANQLTGHSFRAGIPAALAEHPDLASDHEIMIWGRWSSSSFRVYTRLKHEAKLSIFKKIVSMYKLK